MSDSSPSRSSDPTILFIAILSAVIALGPLAMQIFIPALPLIQQDFQTHPSLVQMALSLSMLSIAISMLIYGPLSDRFGRLPILKIGIGVCIIGSLICIWASTIEVLIIGRIIQAAGGAVGMVLARAMARDLYGAKSVRLIAILTMVMVIAPMLAPVLGGYLSDWVGWRYCFVFTAIAAVIILILVYVRLQETHFKRLPMSSLTAMVREYGNLMLVPRYAGYVFFSAFASAVFFSFIALAPYVMANVLNRPPSEYGLYFMLVSGAFMVGNSLAVRLADLVESDRMIIFGAGFAISGTLVLAWMQWSGHLSVLALFLPVALAAFGNGMALPNSQAQAINVFPEHAGSASGLCGFIQQLIAASFVQIGGFFSQNSAWPLVGMLLIAAIAGLGCLIYLFSLRPETAR